jgi:hypothetical protein
VSFRPRIHERAAAWQATCDRRITRESCFAILGCRVGFVAITVGSEGLFMTLTIDVDLPHDLEKFRLPAAVQQRLQTLLDRQDAGEELTEAEKREAVGLVDLADFLSLLRLRSERAA